MEEGRKHASFGGIAFRSKFENDGTRDQSGWIILVSLSLFLQVKAEVNSNIHSRRDCYESLTTQKLKGNGRAD